MTSKTEEYTNRYFAAMHAVQSGIATLLGKVGASDPLDGTEASQCSRKHLRTGVNSALVDCKAMATLLLEKGVFTEEEYVKSLAEAAEAEREIYEKLLTEKYGMKISLA